MIICDKDKCTGCTACGSVCPKDAISFKKNEKGFLYPDIDSNKCVECGRCRKACHINKDVVYNSVKEKHLFRNKDFETRRKSASGGSFLPIADKVIKEGGVVFGAEFSDDVYVQHNHYDEINEASKFSTSKYVQSNLRDSFKQVSRFLLEGRRVLFSGTPCQVSGLKSYLETINCSMDNLILVDFVCHGVGSPKFWGDCLSYYSKKYKSKVVSANFRSKPRPGKLQNLSLLFANGKKVTAPSATMEIYLYHFLRDFILRDSCFSCKYCKTDRVSDITLGDCYSPKEALSYLNDGYGLSQVMANTEKGLEYLKDIGQYGEYVKVEVNEYIQLNQQHPTIKPKDYDLFWKTYVNEGFNSGLRVSNYTSTKKRLKLVILTILYTLHIDPKHIISKFKHP